MNDTLKSLVAVHGMPAVLAGLAQLLHRERDELEDMETAADTVTAGRVDKVGVLVLRAAVAYDAIVQDVA